MGHSFPVSAEVTRKQALRSSLRCSAAHRRNLSVARCRNPSHQVVANTASALARLPAIHVAESWALCSLRPTTHMRTPNPPPARDGTRDCERGIIYANPTPTARGYRGAPVAWGANVAGHDLIGAM